MSRTLGLFELRLSPAQWMRRGIALGAIALIVLLWWLVTLGPVPEERFFSPVILPSPGEVLGSTSAMFSERGLLRAIAASLQRVLLGFGLAVMVGVPLGVLSASFRVFESALAPLATIGRFIPLAALIPLSMLWFGIDETQKVMFIFIACVSFVYFDALQAVLRVHDRYVETAQTLGAGRWQIIVKVLVPLALPAIYTSQRLLFGLAFGYIMLAELVNAKSGLGQILNLSQRRGMTEHIFYVLLVICTIAFTIDRMLAWFGKGFFPHQAKEES